MKKAIQTFEEFIGDRAKKDKRGKHTHGKEVFSIDTNVPGVHYDQEDDGSDQINRSVIVRFSPADKGRM
jgi:hypothetical protein